MNDMSKMQGIITNFALKTMYLIDFVNKYQNS